MSRYYYDLHLHSCLSPCADNDNTPNNLVGMGLLAGLQVMALTDHNTCRNCPAFFEAANKQGIVPIPGMELTTAEDIHMVCLFPDLAAALAFDEEIGRRRVRIPNRPDIFGDQLVMNGADEVVATEPDLLSNATTVTVEGAPVLAAAYGGVCYPAHIDRPANGILATLGFLPPDIPFPTVELHDAAREDALRAQHRIPDTSRVVIGSDAHVLWDIRDKAAWLDIPDEPYSSDLVRRNLIAMLGRGL